MRRPAPAAYRRASQAEERLRVLAELRRSGLKVALAGGRDLLAAEACGLGLFGHFYYARVAAMAYV